MKVLLIGGTSEIGLAILRRLARDRAVEAHLLGRDSARLQAALDGLRGSGCTPGAVIEHDANHPETAEEAVHQAFAQAGDFDLVIHALGLLGAQAGLAAEPSEALAVMHSNFTGAGALLVAALRALQGAGGGSLVVLSSVAAERPRAANAVYGAAKAGLDALAQGLADSVAGTGVRVLVVRPGFVHTKMTAGLEPAPFATTADAVAEATVDALAGSAHTVWVPGILRYVFFVLRHLPRPLYRRLPL